MIQNKRVQKILATILLIITILSNFQGIALAKLVGGNKNLTSVGACRRNIEFKFSTGWSDVKCDYIAYKSGNKNYPAYCITHGKDGVDEIGDYAVDITKVLSDDKIYRVIINGFPYKTAAELGLDNDYDAYMATKQAINCIMLNRNVREKYRGKDEAGNKIVDVMEKLVDIGKNGTQAYQAAKVTATKVKGLTEEGNNYTQTFSVTASHQISTYSILNTANLPSGAYYTDMNGNRKTTFSSGENFKLVIPKSSITSDLNVVISISAMCKTFPVLYGKTRIADTQDYAITIDPYGDYETSITLKATVNNGKIQVKKIDADTSAVIKGVKFQLQKADGTVVETATTDANGIANFNKLYPGKYILKELSTNENYVLNTNSFDINVEYNETASITITNEYKKGNIKINKTDSETSRPIEGVTFQLLDESGAIISTATTNKDGEAFFNDIRIGNYILKETSTNDNYILNERKFDVTVEYSKTTTVEITNEHKRGNIKITKVDKDNKRIPLGNVEFDLFSEEFGRVVGTYYTDVNGELKIENLRTGNYKLIEKTTGKWYNLATDTEINVFWNETTNTIIENELKKGQVRVIKVDLDNQEVRIPGVTFEVLDSENHILEKITTNDNGEALTSRYPIRDFENLKIHEIETDKWYVLNDEAQTVELKANEITSVTFTNEKKKGQIRVIKVDLDNNEVLLEGVTFDILDNKGNIVDTVTTDANGEAISKRLPIDMEYTLKERETLNSYVLTEETQTVQLKEDEITSITFTNEKKKGQVRVIKVDKDNHEVLLEGVTFDVLDNEGNIVDTIVTDSNGEATSKRLPIDQNYILRERETLNTYVLTEETQTVELKENEITSITFENEKIKGYVEILKVDSKTKEVLQGAEFGIYNEKDELIETLKTDDTGKATSNLLPYGKYYLKELNTGSIYYLLNQNTYEFKITQNHITIPLTIENDGVDIEVKVDKIGDTEVKPGEIVNYAFMNVANASNVYLDNFKWFDYIPTDYIRLQSMTTGTWNQDLKYAVYYKTNKSEDYILFKDNLSTNENYTLDFTTIKLADDEYITETCFDFGKVDFGFRESTTPTMQCKSLDTLVDGQTFTNRTRTVGIYGGISADADSNWTTIVHTPKEEHEPVLPRTGK